MVVIRLTRGGSKKKPFYHIVAADRRRARDSRYIERLGFFNPGAKGQEIKLRIDQERVEYWLGEGAQPSDRVKSLIKNAKKDAQLEVAETATAAKAEAEKEAKKPAEATAKA